MIRRKPPPAWRLWRSPSNSDSLRKSPQWWHTVYIEVPRKFAGQITKIHQAIARRFPDKYRYGGVNWKPHVSIVYFPFEISKTERVKQLCVEVARTLEPITLAFGKYRLDRKTGYIFIELNSLSNRKTGEWRRRFAQVLSPLMSKGVPHKYVECWGAFSKQEKQRILCEGAPHEFHAHVSLARIDPADLSKASVILKRFKVKGSFRAETLNLSRERNRIKDRYPVIAKLGLKS